MVWERCAGVRQRLLGTTRFGGVGLLVEFAQVEAVGILQVLHLEERQEARQKARQEARKKERKRATGEE